MPPQPTRQVSYEYQKVLITNASLVLDRTVNGFDDLEWPSNELQELASRDPPTNWAPEDGLECEIVHRFTQPRLDPKLKSQSDEVILLLKSTDKYLLIPDTGVRILPDIDV